jgi:hypothetical protein
VGEEWGEGVETPGNLRTVALRFQERLHHRVLRVVEQFGHRTVGGDAAGTDEGDVVGDPPGEPHLVGDQDEVASFGSEFRDEVEHLGGHLGVQRGGGFVEEQKPGPDGHCAGDGDALALAAREVGGPFAGVGFQSEADQEFAGLAFRLVGREAMHVLEGQRDVPEGREVGEEVVGLEDEPHAGAVLSEGGLIPERERVASEADHARGGGFEAGEKAEQGGFSAAGRADEDERPYALEIQVDVLEHRMVAVGLGEMFEAEVHGVDGQVSKWLRRSRCLDQIESGRVSTR